MPDMPVSAPGWLKLWRKTADSDVWGMSYLTRCVFFWILMAVNYEDRGEVMAGEMTTSYRKIAKGVAPHLGKPPSVKQIRRAIDGLIGAGVVSKIGQTEGQRFLHLKVLRWDQYQSTNGTDPTAEVGQGFAQKRAPSLRRKKEEERKETLLSESSDQFDSFWTLYPKKVAKGHARNMWNSALKKADAQTIIRGLQRQLGELKAREPQYIPNPGTWLNREQWGDEPAQAAKPNIPAYAPFVPPDETDCVPLPPEIAEMVRNIGRGMP
jgi:hypothetical protein